MLHSLVNNYAILYPRGDNMKGKLLRIGTIILGNVFVAFAVSTLVLEIN